MFDLYDQLLEERYQDATRCVELPAYTEDTECALDCVHIMIEELYEGKHVDSVRLDFAMQKLCQYLGYDYGTKRILENTINAGV